MRHVVMTRAAYGPAWSADANARRLALTHGVTLASLAAQTTRDWTWIVAVDRCDPLLDERREVFRLAPVDVQFLVIETRGDRDAAAAMAYRTGWAAALGSRREPLAMTRLDDDDAFAPWALARIRARAEAATGRTALVLPNGIRVCGSRFTAVRHESNAMHTLVTPPGDHLDVYGYGHRKVRRIAPVRMIDSRVAWVWARHDDTISGWHAAEAPLVSKVRALFPIDWELLENAGTATVPKMGAPSGRVFR